MRWLLILFLFIAWLVCIILGINLDGYVHLILAIAVILLIINLIKEKRLALENRLKKK